MPVMRSNLCLVVLFAMTALAGTSVEARNLLVDGASIEKLVPLGFCELESSPVELARKNEVQKSYGANWEVLFMFAPCDELSRFIAGEQTTFSRWGLATARKDNGGYYRLPMTRANFLANIRKYRAEDEAEVLERMESRLARQKRENTLVPAIESNPLAIDDSAYYVGTLTTGAPPNGKIVTISGVSAVTLVKGIGLGYSIFSTTPKTTFADLLAAQMQNLATFTSINER